MSKLRIGVLSDSHIPEVAAELPPQVKGAFKGVDLILHAGDVYTVSVLEELEHLAPVLAARGDDDGLDLYSDRRVEESHVVTIAGVTLWLIHVKPFVWLSDLEPNPDRPGRRDNEIPDVVVFGHTHWPLLTEQKGVLLLNPGSPTFPAYRAELGTVAILTIDGGEAKASIVPLR